MTEDREAFLDRWSRLKREQEAQKPADETAATPAAAGEQKAPELPPVEQLTPESDFRPFMGAQVDGETRRTALKKLFSDAHYNVPDPFEAYSEDYTREDPIPMEMLKTLNHARKVLFDEPEKKVEAAAAAASDGPQTETLQAETPEDAKDAVGKQDA